MDGSNAENAAVVLCLGLHPTSLDKTMQSLVVCSGVLDYFRAIHGRGFIMTVNFSGTKLLRASNHVEGEACLREDCHDWRSVLDKALDRVRRDAPESCKHVEVVLIGTDEVASGIPDPDAVCREFRGGGVRINSIVLEGGEDAGGGDGGGVGGPGGVGGKSAFHKNGWVIIDEDGAPSYTEGWNMARFARETGGLTLFPNTEGKLAIHQLFGEMFRRWGEDYWKKAAAGMKRANTIA